jgi:AcrR family transcriptional regulator
MEMGAIDRSLGLRERNKLEKRRRIYQAARQLFEKQGYDSTTLRQIAIAADVGEGTVFLYAKDKRELLFKIFKDDLVRVFDEAYRKVPAEADFTDRLIAFTTPMLRFLQPHGTLARIMVRENFSLTGQVAAEFDTLRTDLNAKFGRLVSEAQERGQIRADRDVAVLIDAIWANYRFYVDDWLGQPERELGDVVSRLRDGMNMLFEGISTEGAGRASRNRKAKPRAPAGRAKSRPGS